MKLSLDKSEFEKLEARERTRGKECLSGNRVLVSNSETLKTRRVPEAVPLVLLTTVKSFNKTKQNKTKHPVGSS